MRPLIYMTQLMRAGARLTNCKRLTICLLCLSIGVLEAIPHVLRSRQCHLPCHVALSSGDRLESRFRILRRTCSLDRPWGSHSLVYIGYWVFPGIKLPRGGVDHPPTSSAKVNEKVELDLKSPSGLSLPVLGKNLRFTFVGRAWICLDQCSPVRVEAPRRAGLPYKGHTEVHKTRFIKNAISWIFVTCRLVSLLRLFGVVYLLMFHATLWFWWIVVGHQVNNTKLVVFMEMEFGRSWVYWYFTPCSFMYGQTHGRTDGQKD
jgi:hypothetical protein